MSAEPTRVPGADRGRPAYSEAVKIYNELFTECSVLHDELRVRHAPVAIG